MMRCSEDWQTGKRESYSTELNIKLHVRTVLRLSHPPKNSYVLISEGTLLTLTQDLVTGESIGYGIHKGQQINILKNVFKINDNKFNTMFLF